MTIRPRGRPAGTSPHRAEDDQLLNSAARLVLSERVRSPTEAFRRLTKEEDDAVIRRLQRRWQREGLALMDGIVEGLRTSRKAWEETNLAQGAPELYRALMTFSNSPGGIELLAESQSSGAARHTHDFMTMWRLREQHVPLGRTRAEEEFEKAWAQWGRFGTLPDERFLRRLGELCLERADAAAIRGEEAEAPSGDNGAGPSEDLP